MTDITLHPIGDTYIFQGSPDTNYCNEEKLFINTGSERRMFFEFNITSIPEGSVIDSATFYLYHYAETLSDNGKIQRITEDFDECVVTWNDQPLYTTEHEVSITFHGSADWEEYDVKELLQDAYDTGSGYFRFRIIQTTDVDGHFFRSMNYSDSDYHPYLEVTYSGSQYGNVYVKLSGNDSNDGLSWTNAKQTIKSGLETVAANGILHIAFGDYSSQDAITLDKTVSLLCENEGGGGTGTVVLPPTA